MRLRPSMRLWSSPRRRYPSSRLCRSRQKQFRRYLASAGSQPGNTGGVLMQLLERRLDNVIRRAGLARTIWAARQLVAQQIFQHARAQVDIIDPRVRRRR